jgi:hypothetical protein
VIDRAAVFGRRACAALAACSAVLHGFSLGHATSIAATALTVVMLAACLFCARDLWARGTLRAWILVALMNLAMIASHAPASTAHHHSGGVNAAAPVHHSTVMTLATTLAAVEVVAAAAVLYYRTRAVRPKSLSVDGSRLARPAQRPVSREHDVPRNLAIKWTHHCPTAATCETSADWPTPSADRPGLGIEQLRETNRLGSL